MEEFKDAMKKVTRIINALECREAHSPNEKESNLANALREFCEDCGLSVMRSMKYGVNYTDVNPNRDTHYIDIVRFLEIFN